MSVDRSDDGIEIVVGLKSYPQGGIGLHTG